MQWKLFAIAFLFIVPTSLLNAQDNPEVARLQGAWEVNSLIENGEARQQLISWLHAACVAPFQAPINQSQDSRPWMSM